MSLEGPANGENAPKEAPIEPESAAVMGGNEVERKFSVKSDGSKSYVLRAKKRGMRKKFFDLVRQKAPTLVRAADAKCTPTDFEERYGVSVSEAVLGLSKSEINVNRKDFDQVMHLWDRAAVCCKKYALSLDPPVDVLVQILGPDPKSPVHSPDQQKNPKNTFEAVRKATIQERVRQMDLFFDSWLTHFVQRMGERKAGHFLKRVRKLAQFDLDKHVMAEPEREEIIRNLAGFNEAFDNEIDLLRRGLNVPSERNHQFQELVEIYVKLAQVGIPGQKYFWGETEELQKLYKDMSLKRNILEALDMQLDTVSESKIHKLIFMKMPKIQKDVMKEVLELPWDPRSPTLIKKKTVQPNERIESDRPVTAVIVDSANFDEEPGKVTLLENQGALPDLDSKFDAPSAPSEGSVGQIVQDKPHVEVPDTKSVNEKVDLVQVTLPDIEQAPALASKEEGNLVDLGNKSVKSGLNPSKKSVKSGSNRSNKAEVIALAALGAAKPASEPKPAAIQATEVKSSKKSAKSKHSKETKRNSLDLELTGDAKSTSGSEKKGIRRIKFKKPRNDLKRKFPFIYDQHSDCYVRWGDAQYLIGNQVAALQCERMELQEDIENIIANLGTDEKSQEIAQQLRGALNNHHKIGNFEAQSLVSEDKSVKSERKSVKSEKKSEQAAKSGKNSQSSKNVVELNFTDVAAADEANEYQKLQKDLETFSYNKEKFLQKDSIQLQPIQSENIVRLEVLGAANPTNSSEKSKSAKSQPSAQRTAVKSLKSAAKSNKSAPKSVKSKKSAHKSVKAVEQPSDDVPDAVKFNMMQPGVIGIFGTTGAESTSHGKPITESSVTKKPAAAETQTEVKERKSSEKSTKLGELLEPVSSPPPSAAVKKSDIVPVQMQPPAVVVAEKPQEIKVREPTVMEGVVGILSRVKSLFSKSGPADVAEPKAEAQFNPAEFENEDKEKQRKDQEANVAEKAL